MSTQIITQLLLFNLAIIDGACRINIHCRDHFSNLATQRNRFVINLHLQLGIFTLYFSFSQLLYFIVVVVFSEKDLYFNCLI